MSFQKLNRDRHAFIFFCIFACWSQLRSFHQRAQVSPEVMVLGWRDCCTRKQYCELPSPRTAL